MNVASPSHYWTLVRLNTSGGYSTYVVESVRNFFVKKFASCLTEPETSDRVIQAELIQIIRNTPSEQHLAEGCLRCYISHEILRSCQRLIQIYAPLNTNHSLSLAEMLYLVLDDDGQDLLKTRKLSDQTLYRTKAAVILERFDPTIGSLDGWVSRLIRTDRDINSFLIERGIYLISDWAMLNNTEPSQLERILYKFYNLSKEEVERFSCLLTAFHATYRTSRAKDRRRDGGRCSNPTDEQLNKIANFLEENSYPKPSYNAVFQQLRAMGKYLRDYHMSARSGGLIGAMSTSDEKVAARLESYCSISSDDQESESEEFLVKYRAFLKGAIDVAISEAIQKSLEKLNKRDSNRGEVFIKALYLFNKGLTMSKIAKILELQHQYTVTRLLDLKSIRTDIRQVLVQNLRGFIITELGEHLSPDKMHKVDVRLQEVLEDSVDRTLVKARANSMSPKPIVGEFEQQICQALKQTYPDITDALDLRIAKANL